MKMYSLRTFWINVEGYFAKIEEPICILDSKQIDQPVGFFFTDNLPHKDVIFVTMISASLFSDRVGNLAILF